MKTPVRTKDPVKGDGTTNGDAAAEMAAALIREGSAATRLVSASEIRLFLEEHLTPPDTDVSCDDVSAILSRSVPGNEDLQTLSGAGSLWYYSSRSMTEEYAKILLQTLEGPVRLIAATVRHNSREFQRPVPVEFFENPPFNLPYREILDSLTTMAATDGYDDIATTTTSASGIYLYSSTYLEAGHAEMLAEWYDVGQAENP